MQPTVSHIVDAVQIACTFFIVHVLALSTNNFQWIRFVEQFTRFTASKESKEEKIQVQIINEQENKKMKERNKAQIKKVQFCSKQIEKDTHANGKFIWINENDEKQNLHTITIEV